MGSAADNNDLAGRGRNAANAIDHTCRVVRSVSRVYQFVDDRLQPFLRVRRRFTPGAKQVDCRSNT